MVTKDRVIQTYPFIATVALHVPDIEGRKASVLRSLEKPHIITQFRRTVCDGVSQAIKDINNFALSDSIIDLIPRVRRLKEQLCESGQVQLPQLSQISLRDYFYGATNAFVTLVKDGDIRKPTQVDAEEIAHPARRPYNFPLAVGAAMQVIDRSMAYHLEKKGVELEQGNLLGAIGEVVLVRHADDILRRTWGGEGDFFESALYPVIAHASPRGLGWLRRDQVRAFILDYKNFWYETMSR